MTADVGAGVGIVYQVFCDSNNLCVGVWVLYLHGLLSILNLLHEGFKFCFSADRKCYPLVNVINFVARESSVLAMYMSDQSKTRYSCIRRVFFLIVR